MNIYKVDIGISYRYVVADCYEEVPKLLLPFEPNTNIKSIERIADDYEVVVKGLKGFLEDNKEKKNG